MAEDLYVNTTGCWYHASTVNANANTRQYMLDNATADDYGGNCCG